MFEQQSQFPLPALDGAQYGGLAYDGSHIYLTVHGACSILQLDDCFQQVACVPTRRAYAAICYDSGEDCFWAAADGCPSDVFRLSKCLEEIDCIKVRDSKGCCRPITGLSYCCCDHSLVVAFAGEILRVCPACPERQTCVLRAKHGWLFGVLALCPYLLCYCLEGDGGSVCLYTHNGELLHSFPLPCGTEPKGAVFWPCAKEDQRCHILALHTRHGCYSWLCDYALTCGDLCDALCPCHYDICRPCPPPCGDACTDVLESVALVEAALAHILNAEGEKIQKVTASTDNVCKILAVNESVQRTMDKAIFLEQLLCCKLERLSGCCESCDPEPCP